MSRDGKRDPSLERLDGHNEPQNNLSPPTVGRRLDVLRATYVAESIESARARLVQDEARCRRPEPSLAEGAEKRLAELRALLELTQHLQRER